MTRKLEVAVSEGRVILAHLRDRLDLGAPV